MERNDEQDNPGAAPNEPGLEKLLEVVGSSPEATDGEVFLLQVAGSEPGRLHPLQNDELVIGRSKYADIRIRERAMSQQHAKLVRHGNAFRLYDLGSTNGTYVNDVRVNEIDLSPGDLIRTGETVLRFMVGSSEPDQRDRTLALPAFTGGSSRYESPSPLVRTAPSMASRRQPPRYQVLEAPAPGGDGTDLIGMILKVIDFLGRHWISILVLTVLGTAGGIASYRFLKPAAVAEFELTLLPAPTDNPISNNKRTSFQFFQAAKQSFERPALIAETLTEMGYEEVAQSDIRSTQRRLEFKEGRAGQFVYSGTFEADEEETAVEFLQLHLQNYLESEIDKALGVLRKEVETLETKLNDVSKELDETELAIATFKQKNLKGLPEQAQSIYEQLITLGAERTRVETEMARAAAELKVSKRRLGSEAPLVESRIQQAAPYEAAIADAKQKLAAAQAAGKGNLHPEVIALNDQLKQLEKLRDDVMEKGTTSIVRSKNPVYESARMSVDDAKAAYEVAASEFARLNQNLEETEAMVAELPRLQNEYNELTRSYEATKAIHSDLLSKLNTSKVQLAMEEASASARYDVITPPNVVPDSPIKTMAIRGAAGCFLGFFFAVLFGLIGELRRVVTERQTALARRV